MRAIEPLPLQAQEQSAICPRRCVRSEDSAASRRAAASIGFGAVGHQQRDRVSDGGRKRMSVKI
jgi:hypothetical protein